jgi:hypothetical protein
MGQRNPAPIENNAQHPIIHRVLTCFNHPQLMVEKIGFRGLPSFPCASWIWGGAPGIRSFDQHQVMPIVLMPTSFPAMAAKRGVRRCLEARLAECAECLG